MAVPAADDLEEQVGVAVVVGQVAQFVDALQLGPAVVADASLQGARAVPGGEIVEHLAGGDEADRGTGEQGLVGQILGDHGLADPVGSDEDGVADLVEPA